MYLGINADYSSKDLKTFSKYKVTKVKNIEQVLKCLLKHQIIAVCRNTAEMGQRALGNRSILAADQDLLKTYLRLTEQLSKEIFWMPFAPVILSEYQNKLIKNPKSLSLLS